MPKRTTHGHAQLSDVIADHPHIRYIAQQHGRMLEVAIYRGNKTRALAVVEEAFRLLGDSVRYDPATRLDAVLSARLAGLLEASQITTIGQLCGLTRREISRFPQIRFTTCEKIEAELAEMGLSLKSSST